MSALRKSSSVSGRVATATRREIISTCQIKTVTGTPVTWTAFRAVGAPASGRPDCYVCTLPDNTGEDVPSQYSLSAIAGQALTFPIDVTSLDRDVVYLVTPTSGGPAEQFSVARGVTFQVLPRSEAKVTLTFDGDYFTIEAVPTRPVTVRPGEQEPAPFMPTDEDTDPPPPLPNEP